MRTYEALGLDMHKPYLRAAMEKDMKLIAEGKKDVDNIRKECIESMLKIFKHTKDHSEDIITYFKKFMKEDMPVVQ